MNSRVRVFLIVAMLLPSFAAVVGGCCPHSPDGDPPGDVGRFDADVADVQLLPDGRKARLLKPFAYTDGAGVRWEAPAGEVVDGASIPRIFWTVIGGPYEGKYRFASIVHDRYCVDHGGRSWQDVHRMFYHACLAGGTEPSQARLMYAAVYHFGPRWELTTNALTKNASQLAELIPPERARIARKLEEMSSGGAAAEVGAEAIPDEQAYRNAVLAPRDDAGLEALDPVLEKWERIRDKVRENPNIELKALEDVQ